LYFLNYRGTSFKISDSLSKKIKRIYYTVSSARSAAKRLISETKKMYDNDDEYFSALGTENMSLDMFEIIEYNLEEINRFSV